MPTVGRLAQPRSRSRATLHGHGLVARFAPIRGITPKKALDRQIFLPAMLDTFTVAETALHNEYDTLSAGHFSQAAMGPAGARQFRTLSVNAITVDFDAHYLIARDQDPYELRARLYEVLRARKPVHLLVFFHPAADRTELDMYCTLREIDKDVRPGENESRYLTLSISEWRDPNVTRRSSKSHGGASRKKGVSLPTTTALSANDTLASLSFEFYGRYDGWRSIRDANGIPHRFGQKSAITSLPGKFKVGYKLKIPVLDLEGKLAPGVGTL